MFSLYDYLFKVHWVLFGIFDITIYKSDMLNKNIYERKNKYFYT